ncbi:MAG TPA: S41 family peptidase [Allosphingosinicella sp.]|nr:S41 family peptidase [Allosphingosinicella sp.]
MFKRYIAAGLLAGTAAALSAQTPPPGAAPTSAAPRPAQDFTVTAEECRRTALDLAAKLEENYVFPDVAKRYGAMLRANVASGAYDGFTSGREFAIRLGADLRAVSPDAHLRVGPRPSGPGSSPAGPAPAGAGPAPAMRARTPLKPIDEARWLAPRIAYIRFNVFPGDPETIEGVRRFMAEHATARTIIFDNRTHHGGGLDEMDVMFPYLFAKPTTLVTMDTRASVDKAGGNPVEDSRVRVVPAAGDVVRHEHYVEPSKTEKRLFKAKVFVLTSGATASAAEHMTLALKRTHRATIVGESTAGAGHYGGVQPIGDRFSAFIPVGRTFDADTGKDWEDTGIAPDVAVPAEQALTEALVRAGLSRAAAEKISAEVKPTGPMTRRSPRRS